MRFRDIPAKLLKSLIAAYAYAVSPLLGPNCRFHPTCSHYAMEAIDRHGAVKGFCLGLRRILKCHPWHRGDMLDPVPERIDWPAIIGYKRAKPENHKDCGCSNQRMKE